METEIEFDIVVQAEERLFGDDGKPVVAVAFHPVVMSEESYKELTSLLVEHTLRVEGKRK